MTEEQARALHDAVLVGRAQLGDLRALDLLLTTLQAPLYRHICHVMDGDDGAEDVMQETLLTISRKIGMLREPRWLRAWAFRIATRLAVRHSRRAQENAAGADATTLEDIPVEESIPQFDADEITRVVAALDGVPRASQLVIRMHYLEGLSLAEVAEALEISIGTVKSRLNYGLKSLRRAIPRNV
jgi:RNA polymerase sigma-70 factor, ECF subfamily